MPVTYSSGNYGEVDGNLVITRNAGYQREGIGVYPSLESAFRIVLSKVQNRKLFRVRYKIRNCSDKSFLLDFALLSEQFCIFA